MQRCRFRIRTRCRRWRSVVQRKGRGCGPFRAGLKQIWCFAVLYSRSIMRSGSPGRNGEKGPQRRRGLALAHRERGVSEVSKSRCEGCALWGSLSQRAADWANASSCMQLLRKVHRSSRHTVLEATLSLHLEATRRVVLYRGGYKAVLAPDACTTRLGGTLLGPLREGDLLGTPKLPCLSCQSTTPERALLGRVCTSLNHLLHLTCVKTHVQPRESAIR